MHESACAVMGLSSNKNVSNLGSIFGTNAVELLKLKVSSKSGVL